MSDPIISMAKVMRLDIERVNNIAQNIANSNTSGFIAQKSAIDGSKFSEVISGDIQEALVTEFDQGVSDFTSTGIKTNLALNTDYWFVLNKEDSIYISRNGQFYLENNQVKSPGGYTLQGLGGSLDFISGVLSFDEYGNVYSDENYIDSIRLIQLQPGAELIPVGDSTFKVGHSNKYLDVGAVDQKILSVGSLNTSNVDSGAEMIKLMETTRHIESVQRAISAYDDILKSGINELGK